MHTEEGESPVKIEGTFNKKASNWTASDSLDAEELQSRMLVNSKNNSVEHAREMTINETESGEEKNNFNFTIEKLRKDANRKAGIQGEALILSPIKQPARFQGNFQFTQNMKKGEHQ